jgi:hypothetical protein
MKITAYIPLQFYDYDKSKIDSLEKLKEHLFLPPEDFRNLEEFTEATQNRDKLKRFPIYLDKNQAEWDSSFFTGAEEGDYGKVFKVSIIIEEEVYNQLEEEQKLNIK